MRWGVRLIEKILVALDGSEPADRALDFAVDLAGKYSAELVLLSVFEPVIPSLLYPPMDLPIAPSVAVGSYAEELKAHHRKVLTHARRKAKKARPDLKISTKIVEGRPAEKIVETAEQGKFDMIVIGSQGLGGIKKIFLGSVSDRVADEASCPVLIIK
jgi:nucleotide-binding universal stress UspA family protein